MLTDLAIFHFCFFMVEIGEHRLKQRSDWDLGTAPYGECLPIGLSRKEGVVCLPVGAGVGLRHSSDPVAASYADFVP